MASHLCILLQLRFLDLSLVYDLACLSFELGGLDPSLDLNAGSLGPCPGLCLSMMRDLTLVLFRAGAVWDWMVVPWRVRWTGRQTIRPAVQGAPSWPFPPAVETN